jgi:hypothetical protein
MKNKSLNPLHKMIPGVVCMQWVRCGRPNCRCTSGRLHGPYHYLFWREQGRLRKQYIKAVDLDCVRCCCEARRKHQQQLFTSQDEWRHMVGLVRQLEEL